MCDETHKNYIGEWAKNAEYRKIIMGVVKARLDLAWPYNYKALDILSIMPSSELAALHEKLKSFSEGASTIEGGAELKKIVKPILKKAEEEMKTAEAEDMAKKQEAMLSMWGGIWANNTPAPAMQNMNMYGWAGPPGLPAHAMGYQTKAPDGWTPYVMVPVPRGGFHNPMYGLPTP